MAKDSGFTPRRRIPSGDAKLMRSAERRFGRRLVAEIVQPRRATRGVSNSAAAVGALIVVAALAAWEPVSTWAFNSIAGPGPTTVSRRGESVSIRFSMCGGASDTDCVIDGDTVRFSGMTVRIADIDTPETRDFGCASEKALGDRATRRLRDVLNAGPFEVEGYARDEDVYGRKLRILTRDGVSIGETLVAEGLARWWDGSRHPWC